MLINEQSIDLIFKGFQAKYRDSYDKTPAHADRIAMTVPSTTREETYGWLGAFPRLREWVGPRHINSLTAHSFTIRNRKFEATVAVARDDISDDRFGIYAPLFAEMGVDARTHPEELVFGLLASGFDTLCYDGQYFFDTDHPVADKAGNVQSVSNMQAGSGPAWYLIDPNRAVRPIIWQEREGYEFQRMDRPTDPHVFSNDQFLYGVRARANAGFGLWQLAFGSKAALDKANYAAARAAMRNFRSDGGRPLGIMPSLLIVPPALEEDALYVINVDRDEAGASNPWNGTAELIVSPYLTA